MKKKDFPVSHARKFLEPGPVVLVSSQYQNETNIMTMGWHMVMQFIPSLIGCLISAGNHSYELIRNSGECVINIPSSNMIDTIIEIGTHSGTHHDKFSEHQLTVANPSVIKAPLIDECFANLECQLYDDRMIDDYSLFIFEVVKAHVADVPEWPKTIHYKGNGEFMESGKMMSFPDRFSGEYF